MTPTISNIPPSWVFIAVGLGSFLLIRLALQSPVLQAHYATGPFRLISPIVSSWLAPTAVMVVFIGLSGTLMKHLENSPWVNSPAPSLPKDLPVSTEPLIQEATTSGEAPLIVKPDWAIEGDTTSGDVRTIVLQSKLWSTPEEARKELAPRAAAIIRKDFDDLHPGVFSRVSERALTADDLLQFARKKEYVEHINQDFGSFQSPMCRLWMQIEVSPIVRTAIYPTWKSAVIGNRILATGYYLSFLTLAANAVVLFTRLRAAPRGNWMAAGFITISSMLAWGAVCVYWMRLLIQ